MKKIFNSLINSNSKIKNQFGLSEFSGAVGDLGTLLPLAFALIVFNGFPVERIFFLWGIVYLITGFFYKVPVSVQPLKAMSVIAIAAGFSLEMLTTTAFFYGILLIILSATGLIEWLQKLFSPALVRGIQLGIGLILFQKAIELVLDKGLFLGTTITSTSLNVGILVFIVLLLMIFQFKIKFPITLVMIGVGIMIAEFSGIHISDELISGSPFAFAIPEPSLLIDGFILLIIPQLPLTLGNAIYAASDSCHTLWGKQARKVNPTRLGLSIGISDAVIGLMGGFPICHGSGGMGAHAQFGGKTGGTTIILGGALIIAALVSPLSKLLFLIPVPLLGAMLLFDGWRMMTFIKKLALKQEVIIAVTVGSLSFATRNLTIALVAGLLMERIINFIYAKNKLKLKGVIND